MCIIYVYYASVKHYPTNDPLEGVCLRRKAGGKSTQKKDARADKTMQMNETNHQSAAIVQRKMQGKNKKRRCSHRQKNEHSKGPFRARDLRGGGGD